jgi:hypothetical protein
MTKNTDSSTKLELGKSGTSKKTPLQPKIIWLKIIVFLLSKLVTPTSSEFESRIEIKVETGGGQVLQVLIEGSKPPHKPPHLCQLNEKPPV